MENIPGPCSLVHDAPGNYQRKHDPFVFFRSVRGGGRCPSSVVGLPQLAADLGSVQSTPNLAFITPDECNDGHTNCGGTVPSGFPPTDTAAELAQADAFLKVWVPRILASPAFKQDGLLVVAFDESDTDLTACCNEQPGPADANPGGESGFGQESPGPGGGQTGAVLLSPFITPGGVSTVQYNHYSLLRSIEDLFGLGHLGFAGQAGLAPFGTDIFDRTPASAGGGSGAGAGAGAGAGTRRLGAFQLVAGGAVRLPQSVGCFSGRRFTISVRRTRRLHVRALDVYVNRRLVVRVRGRRLRVPVNLTGLPKGTFTVRVVVHARRGGRRVTLRDRRTYHTCAPGRSAVAG